MKQLQKLLMRKMPMTVYDKLTRLLEPTRLQMSLMTLPQRLEHKTAIMIWETII